ncbi:hypothetical protein EDC04DRAFT_2873516 [Pisolithus marmoratus]|nr:hypothetical protein EDC04DRAFT_2873516 [Pisolithus marmoratus]
MATAKATIPLKYQPQRYYCTDTVNPDCQKGFISAAGLNHHYNAVHKHHTTRPSCAQQHPWQPTGQHDGSGDDNEPQGPYYVKHPVLDGTPVDLNGDDLPEGASPQKPNTPSKRTWHPFESRAHFELADFIFHQNEIPGAQIDGLMHIWASMPGQSGTPPYANHEHLYSTIDAISEGDAPWTSFSMESVEAGGSGGPSWKNSGTYEVVFHDPQGQHVWSDFMTGNWAWNQLTKPVSVATGNNEYYPLYISAGDVHNGMRHAHGEAVSLLGFLSIPKTDKEFEADPEFCTFWRHLFHTSLEAIFHAMHPAMTKPQSVKCADGHYCRAIYGLGPYIADYPEQALLACIQKYGIPFTASFPHANIHELIAPDILHQIIKGTFKDHLVSWVETYLKKYYKNDFAAVLADIDHHIAVVPSFPGLQHFSQGHGFKQWTGYVPSEMLQAFSAFMDFCYIHYHEAIELFGAPNGLSTSIVESKHIHAEMAQVLLVNQQQDKLEQFQAECLAEGKKLAIGNLSLLNNLFSGLLDRPLIPQDTLHEDTSFQDDPYLQDAEDDDSERADAVVQLAHKPSEMGQDICHPELPDLVSIFLFQQRNPGVDIPNIYKCPKAIDPGYSFSSAVATFYAPSDFSGASGMHCQCIHASSSWRNGAPHYDCVFVEMDPTLPGFQGLYVAQQFTPIGDEPCINTGMWKVEHEYEEYGDHLVTHLIGIYGDEYIPPDLHYSDSLAAFGSFYVNKYSDDHAFGLAF